MKVNRVTMITGLEIKDFLYVYMLTITNSFFTARNRVGLGLIRKLFTSGKIKKMFPSNERG